MIVQTLTEEQKQLIHQSSLNILNEVGVKVPHDKVLDMFKAAGAEVDDSTKMVKIPENLIMESLDKAGKKFTIYGRDRNKQAKFGFGTCNFNSIFGEAFWIEDNMKRRYTSLDDVVTAARIGDALEHINIVGAMADPKEIPPAYRCVEVAAKQLDNTTKPIGFWFYNRQSAKYVLEIFEAVAGSKEEVEKYPFTYPFFEPISPLSFPFDGIDLLFETSRYSLPVPIGPMAQTGTTAPGTLAGTLIQENAEILAGIVITQLIKPGLSVCYGGIPHTFDMKITQMVFGGPEQAIMATAMTEMGKYYDLPVYINVGLTDSKTVDAQAGMEAGITLALGALSGADIFGHLGISGMDQGSSLTMLVMQNELIGYVKRLMQEINFSEDALGLDVIKEVGPGGTFISEMHTARHFRDELWFPELLDRNYWEEWETQDNKELKDRCLAKKNKLIKNHKQKPLAKETKRDIDKILASARKKLV